MLQVMVVHGQYSLDEVQRLCRSDAEDIYLYQLSDEVTALVWRDLQSVDPQGEENLGQTLLWLGFFISGPLKLVFVVFENLFRDKDMSFRLILLQLEK
jgi:hypothetical protein